MNEDTFDFLISYVSLGCLNNIIMESFHCFWECDRNSGCRFCIMVCMKLLADYYLLIYTQCWVLMKSLGRHGSLSLLFVMKVMVRHFLWATLVRSWPHSLLCYHGNVVDIFLCYLIDILLVSGYTSSVVAGLWPSLVKSLVLLNTAGQVVPNYKQLAYRKVGSSWTREIPASILFLKGWCTWWFDMGHYMICAAKGEVSYSQRRGGSVAGLLTVP